MYLILYMNDNLHPPKLKIIILLSIHYPLIIKSTVKYSKHSFICGHVLGLSYYSNVIIMHRTTDLFVYLCTNTPLK